MHAGLPTTIIYAANRFRIRSDILEIRRPDRCRLDRTGLHWAVAQSYPLKVSLVWSPQRPPLQRITLAFRVATLHWRMRRTALPVYRCVCSQGTWPSREWLIWFSYSSLRENWDLSDLTFPLSTFVSREPSRGSVIETASKDGFATSSDGAVSHRCVIWWL